MTSKSRTLRKIALIAFWGLFFLASSLLHPASSHAQSPVNVTATVKDSAGIPYSNATVSILLIPTGTAPTVGGAQINGTNNGQLDVNGKLNVSLYKNTDIVPANSKWQFTICETPGVAPPLGTGGQCFNSSQTISAAVDLSTQFQAAAPALTTITFGGSGSVTHTAGNLTAGNVVIGNGVADVKVDSACVTNGTGALSGCTSINTPGTVTGNIGSFNSVGTNLIDIACGAQSVGNANQVRASCDGTNWPVWSMNGITAAKAALSMGVNAQTVGYTATQSDCGKLITMNGVSLTLTLPAAIINSACVFDVKNLAATSLTIARNGLNVDGAASNPTALTQNQSYRITNDGAGYWTEALQIGSSGTVTNVATTSPITGGPITATGTIGCPTCNTFSINNIVPKGNGTTLVSSSITDNGSVINASEDITSTGSVAAGSNIGETVIQSYLSGTTGSLNMNSLSQIRLSATGNATGSCDTSLSRVSAGVWGVGATACAAGDVTGAISATVIKNGCGAIFPSVNITPVTVNGNVTTDQNLMALTLAAGCLNKVGRGLRIYAAGVYSTAATSTAQITMKAELCTVSGCGSGTVVAACSIQTIALASVTVTNNTWAYDCLPLVQTAGASAVFERSGKFSIDLGSLTSAADSIFLDPNATAVTSAIDSTAGLFLQITGAFSAASATNAFTERQLVVEVLN